MTDHDARLQEPPAPPERETTWQPIVTAPKDGTTVLLWWESYGVVYWGSGYWKEFGDGSRGWIGESFHASAPKCWTRLIGEKPTHWMPLPDPPSRTPAPERERSPERTEE